MQELTEKKIPIENVRICYSPFSRTSHTAKVVASVLDIPFDGPQCKACYPILTDSFPRGCLKGGQTFVTCYSFEGDVKIIVLNQCANVISNVSTINLIRLYALQGSFGPDIYSCASTVSCS